MPFPLPKFSQKIHYYLRACDNTIARNALRRRMSWFFLFVTINKTLSFDNFVNRTKQNCQN